MQLHGFLLNIVNRTIEKMLQLESSVKKIKNRSLLGYLYCMKKSLVKNYTMLQENCLTMFHNCLDLEKKNQRMLRESFVKSIVITVQKKYRGSWKEIERNNERNRRDSEKGKKKELYIIIYYYSLDNCKR